MVHSKRQGQATSPRKKLRMSTSTADDSDVASRNYYETMMEQMLAHESIAKATRVYEQDRSACNVDGIAEQYCRFMVLKILSGDFAASGAKLSPGGAIDEFWHCHVLDTAGYSAFFQAVLPPLGPMVHHDAEKSLDTQEEIRARQEKTKEVYQQVFKEHCPFFAQRQSQIRTETRIVVIHNPFQIFVTGLRGETSIYRIGQANTIEDIKFLIQKKDGVPVDQQRLILVEMKLEDGRTIHGGQVEDGRTIRDYGITEGSRLDLALRLRGC